MSRWYGRRKQNNDFVFPAIVMKHGEWWVVCDSSEKHIKVLLTMNPVSARKTADYVNKTGNWILTGIGR